MKDYKLICTNCNELYSKETVNLRCDHCGEPLELELIKTGKIKEGNVLEQNLLERYADFYPFININKDISLGEGFTPLINSKSLANKIGIKGLYFKNEGVNPTWSFKDRGTITGVLRALDLEYKGIGTVSTGNMAASVAAYGAKAGLHTIIFVKDEIADEKLKPIAIYNPKLVKVKGDYGKLYSESIRLGGENNYYFINSDVPYRVEGYKTIAFEICEQLKFNIPDYVIVPTSAGGDIRGIEKGFREFKECGLIDKIPKMICVQASGCSPISKAYKENSEQIERFENPKTIAHAIENPFPPSGNAVLRMIKQNGGIVVDVSDGEILESQKELASIGLFVQPASATSLAAVKKLKKNNFLIEEDRVVCIITASGLKFTKALDKHRLDVISCDIEDLSKIIR